MLHREYRCRRLASGAFLVGPILTVAATVVDVTVVDIGAASIGAENSLGRRRAFTEGPRLGPPRGPSVDRMVEAAGGLVVRWTMRERAEVLVVHRPGRDDWTFPKGKRRRSESHVECALREVREETGLWCELGDELPSTRYRDRKGRPKLVRYWAMSSYAGEFAPNREVDEVRWVHLERVGDLLSFDRDLMVARGLRALSAVAG